MDTSVLAKQRNKLIGIGIFLVLVAFAIGGEDRPGLVSMFAQNSQPQPEVPYEPLPQAPPSISQSNENPALDSWYSEAAPKQEAKPDEPEIPEHQPPSFQPSSTPDESTTAPSNGIADNERPY